MASQQSDALFNLKAVVQQTGVKPDTLRAWERRYGLPRPERSAGRHRLYSSRDIQTIQWLVARQQEGLSIGRAVELWRQIESSGRDPVVVPLPVGLRPAVSPAPAPAGVSLVQLRSEWTAACLAFDEQRAEQAVSEAFALFPAETVCFELLQRGMAEIGEGWYRGGVTVQQEHFASALATRRLEALVMAAPPPTRPGRILAACPPQEEHVFGLLLATYLLRRRGWEVVYLGANVPIGRLADTVATTNPRLVVMAAQRLPTAATLLQAAQVLEQEGVPMAYGGKVFNILPKLRRRIPGRFLGEHLEEMSHAVESLMAAPRPSPASVTIPEQYLRARDHFLQRESRIQAQLTEEDGLEGAVRRHIAHANRELALNIDAALALGDMDYLGTDFDWVKGLLSSVGLPPGALDAYLAAYYQAARENLDEPGALVLDWLDRVLSERGRHAA